MSPEWDFRAARPYDRPMPGPTPPRSNGRGGLAMFAQGDRVFPLDDLGGGVWSRVGTVVAVHHLDERRVSPGDDPEVRVEDARVRGRGWQRAQTARVTVLWDDGSHEVIGEDSLCLVYSQQEPIGVRVVTAPIDEPFDIVARDGHVVLVVREGLLGPHEVGTLREKLRRVRARIEPAPETLTAGQRRVRELGLLRALVAQLTAEG